MRESLRMLFAHSIAGWIIAIPLIICFTVIIGALSPLLALIFFFGSFIALGSFASEE